MTRPGIVHTGRLAMQDERRHALLCASCEQRIKMGDPRASETWPWRLRQERLSEDQADLLLVAAAEFERIGGGSAVDFMDWVRPDALGLTSHLHPELDGVRGDAGTLPQADRRAL